MRDHPLALGMLFTVAGAVVFVVGAALSWVLFATFGGAVLGYGMVLTGVGVSGRRRK